MGWFWSDGPQPQGQSPSRNGMSPPPGCPMHKHQKSADALTMPTVPAASGCPVPHGSSSITTTSLPPSACPIKHTPEPESSSSSSPSSQSTLSKLNPLNYMFRDLSQERAPQQTQALPTSRDPSTIPRGDGSGQNWEYPSPQQMYHALLRKGYSDTDVTAVESMVGVHNFLNEGAWAEIVEWERRFAGGLVRGWKLCSRGEQNFESQARRLGCQRELQDLQPSLMRFQGRPQEMTPKAAMLQVMGWIYPGAFATEPPFDRHDWYVSREANGQQKEVRYIIDYYSGPPEPTGEPVFFLDVRPAFTPTGAAERALRWGCDTWWKASGGDVREAEKQRAALGEK